MAGAGRRALDEPAKAARRRQILDAAGRLFESQPYAAVSVARIAHAAGIAKGTIYLYVDSREALFMALFDEALEAFIDTAAAALAALPAPRGAEAAAQALVVAAQGTPYFVRLAALMPGVIEAHLPPETAGPWAERLLGRCARLSAGLAAVLDLERAETAAAMTTDVLALLIGYRQLCPPRPGKAAKKAGDFATAYRRGLAACLEAGLRRDRA